MQRTIAECVNDIKSILNNAERTQECSGETLVDIDELANEILSINGTKDEPLKPVLCMNEKSGMFVDYADGHGEYKTQTNNWWKCPHCNSIVGERIVVHDRIHDQRKKAYCEKCGQKIGW